MRIRELTFDERARWGKCPVCKAPDGELCNSSIGFAFGCNISGGPPAQGAHLGRIQRAPHKVQEIPC